MENNSRSAYGTDLDFRIGIRSNQPKQEFKARQSEPEMPERSLWRSFTWLLFCDVEVLCKHTPRTDRSFYRVSDEVSKKKSGAKVVSRRRTAGHLPPGTDSNVLKSLRHPADDIVLRSALHDEDMRQLLLRKFP